MKRAMSIFLAVIMILLTGNSAIAVTEKKIVLSELSESECIVFLKENGVEIPDEFDNELVWGTFAKEIIAQVEANPDVTFPFGYTVLCSFANDIKCVVNTYYGTSEKTRTTQTWTVTSL